jgi:hypothetical protein
MRTCSALFKTNASIGQVDLPSLTPFSHPLSCHASHFPKGKAVDNPLHEAALLTVPRGPRGAGLSPAKAGAGAAASSETPPVVASVKLAKVR